MINLEWSEYLGQMASIVGSLTVVGGALIWIYKKLVSDADLEAYQSIGYLTADDVAEMTAEEVS